MCHHLFFKIYCNKDCNREGEPNGTPFKLWEKSHGKIKSNFVLEKRRLHGILGTTFNLDWHLETLAAAELCLFDRQLMIVLDIGNGHWRIIFQMDIHINLLVILVKYSASDYYSWNKILSLLFLKSNIIITIPQDRCCCSVVDVEYCCWIAEVIYWSWVLEVR